MKEYLEVLKHVYTFGVDHKEDRTGAGRRRVFSIQKRIDISNGRFPLVTTREINPMLAIGETLMFIKGLTNVDFLHSLGLKFWDAWSVKKETTVNYLQKLVDANLATPEQAAMAAMNIDPKLIGEIGPMYGHLWRHWPISNHEIHKPTMHRTVEDVPSDFKARLIDAYESVPEEEKTNMSLNDWILIHYYSAVDQLNELVLNLKKDPYGSRHLVTAFNPEYTPVPGYTPDENVLMNKGCLMPCHFAFQCFVNPPKEEGGKKRLSLKFHIR